MENSAKRIAYLIRNHIFTIISTRDKNELVKWVNQNPENKRVFSDATDEMRLQQAFGFLTETDIERKLAIVKERGNLQFSEPIAISVYNNSSPTHRIGLRQFKWIAAAAVFLLIAGSAIFLYISTNEVTDPTKILPGGPRAEIAMSDGTVVDLETQTDGLIGSSAGHRIMKKDRSLDFKRQTTYTKNGDQYTVTTIQGINEVQLPDGSKLWLNAGSSVNFPATFASHERRVSITGEVYFEITQSLSTTGQKIPFKIDVKGKNMMVEVLGTSFNINSYQDEPVVKTTLIEGSVRITAKGNVQLLKPNQQSEISDTGSKLIDLEEVYTDAAKAWKEGNFDFDKYDTRSIMREIGRWYNMEIEYSKDIPNRQFGGFLKRNVPLAEVLKLLELNGMKFKIKGKKIIVLS